MPIHLLQFAKKLAYDAGRMALTYQKKSFSVSTKGSPNDLVTDVDKICDEFLIKTIHSHFPDHSILTEESGVIEGSGEYKWIIDPIDGTTNFAHGLPFFAISIAIIHKGKPIIGVVEAPGLGETFWAQEGKGAYSGMEPIHVSKTGNLGQSLFGTGFPCERTSPRYKKNVELFDQFYGTSHGVRRIGSAALDLCFVARGSFDGFWEYDLQTWDVAAGKIILEEAGGTVTNMDGSTFNPKLKNIVGSNGLIHSEMLRVIREHGGEKL
ncbi:MAG: inositol monophosphatase family protein [Candidatus Gracilibacteria bacterium]